MKLAICLSATPARFEAVPFKGNLEENFHKIGSMGFQGVELAIRDPLELDLKKILGAAERTGLEIPALGTGQAWGEDGLSFTNSDKAIGEAAVKRVFTHIDFAAEAGAMVIIGLVRGMVRAPMEREEAEQLMEEAFLRCCRYAEREGVRIAFEPINRYETTLLNSVEESAAFIDRIGMENLGMLLDTFHMNIEEPSICDSIRKAGKRIFHVHYADSNRRYPGAGHLDFPLIIKSLKEAGYKGYLSGEHLPWPEPEEAVRRGLVEMKKLI